eukprot:scaffold249142_cov25-Prasinocladus_malaysianus.AAC.1
MVEYFAKKDRQPSGRASRWAFFLFLPYNWTPRKQKGEDNCCGDVSFDLGRTRRRTACQLSTGPQLLLTTGVTDTDGDVKILFKPFL